MLAERLCWAGAARAAGRAAGRDRDWRAIVESWRRSRRRVGGGAAQRGKGGKDESLSAGGQGELHLVLLTSLVCCKEVAWRCGGEEREEDAASPAQEDPQPAKRIQTWSSSMSSGGGSPSLSCSGRLAQRPKRETGAREQQVRGPDPEHSSGKAPPSPRTVQELALPIPTIPYTPYMYSCEMRARVYGRECDLTRRNGARVRRR